MGGGGAYKMKGSEVLPPGSMVVLTWEREVFAITFLTL